MHNKKFQNELDKSKEYAMPIKSNPHKAFVEKLKSQILSDKASSSTDGEKSTDDDLCNQELMKGAKTDSDTLFADLDDDDD